VLAERTKELLSDSHPELAERSGVELKGKRERVKVYAPRSEATEGPRADEADDASD
jgi:hypothetical protein